MAVFSSLATIGVTLGYFLDYAKKSFSFLAALAFLHFFVVSFISSSYEAIYFYPEAPNLGILLILEAIFLGFLPALGLILSLVFLEKKRWALPIVISIAFVLLLAANGFFIARGAVQDYGEPSPGRGGPLHFLFLLSSLFFSFLAGIFAIVLSYKERFRLGLHR